MSSTKLNTAVEKPPISRFALAAMASNTGCTSDGELAMTFRMSAVAVCRSSASLVSLNSRAFSIAMTAWSAKVVTSSICFCENGSTRCRASTMVPIGSFSRNNGTQSAVC